MTDRRCNTADEVAKWIVDVSKRYGHSGRNGRFGQGAERDLPSTESIKSTLSTKIYPELSANAALVLIAVACSLLDRQVERLAKDFENQGGFTERLYRVRSARRRHRR